MKVECGECYEEMIYAGDRIGTNIEIPKWLHSEVGNLYICPKCKKKIFIITSYDKEDKSGNLH